MWKELAGSGQTGRGVIKHTLATNQFYVTSKHFLNSATHGKKCPSFSMTTQYNHTHSQNTHAETKASYYYLSYFI